MIRKHIPKYSLIVISLLIALLISGTVSAEVGDWTIEGDKVYVDDSKVYLSATPHTLSESGFVYFDINTKTYTGDVDLYFGFNSGGMKPTRAYYNNGGEWINIASQFNKVNYDYDDFDTWYYSNNLPVNAGHTYKIAVWMERANEISSGKYGFAIKPSHESINQAITNDHFYYLDPWWDSNWNSLSTVTLNTQAPEDGFQVHLSSDDYSIPLKMWDNMNHDGNDTRFLHTDNTTVFPMWIEYFNARDDYSIWVNVTDITTGSTLLWYYGNPSVSTASNGDATFLQYHGSETASFVDTADLTPGAMIYEGRVKITTGSTYLACGISNNQNPTTDDSMLFMFTHDNNKRYIRSYNEGTVTLKEETFDISTDVFYRAKVINTGTNIRGYLNDNQIGSGNITTNLPNENTGLFLYNFGVGSVAQDWSFARKYNVVEPIISYINITTFFNTPPTKPDIINPINSSFLLSTPVELNVSSTDVENETITYTFYGDMIDGSTLLGINDTINGSSYNWSVGQYGTYYWKAIAHDGYNYSEYSNVSQFTLLIPPNLTSPTNQSTEYTTYPPLTSTISFTWQDLSIPQYRLMIAEDINFNVMIVDIHVGTNNSDQTLIVNKEYFWKIYSYNGTTYSYSSNIYRFDLTGNSSLTGSTIEGVVYQSNGDITAISGAEVSIWNLTWSSSMVTGSNGYYVFEDLDDGTVYNLQAKADRYWDSSISLVNATNDPVTNNFYLIDDLTDTEWWHYVEFTVQNVWGVTYPGVATKVYIGDSPTIYDSGNTESDGTISFHLDQNIEYRITFINSTLGINEDITLYPISNSYTVYIDSYSFDLPEVVTDDIQAYITSSRINATYGYINFTWSDTSDLTTHIVYSISDVDGNVLYNTSTTNSDLFDSQVVTATDDRYVVRYVGVHPTHGVIDKTETIVFHGGRRVDFGWEHDWQYAVTSLAFLIFIGSLFGAKTAHYGAIAVVMFAFIFKWIGWLNETNTSTLLIILAAVIAFGWSLRKSEEVKT